MIELKNVTRIFKDEKGIKDLNFEIPEKSIVVFIGNNGAGKTTAIRAISGELKLHSGEVLIDGEDLFKNNNLKKIAFFPDTNSIPRGMTVYEYVRYSCAAHGIRESFMLEKTTPIYELLGISGYINTKIKHLSSGTKKKVAMVSALVLSPKYIIFDEPTANLDIESKIEFIEIIRVLNSLNVSIMITSHLIEELEDIATHVVLINDGKIVYKNEFDKKKEKILDIYKKFVEKPIFNKEIIKDLY
ncbi:ABC transporter ATP-binding protein [Spiroplasma monobiae]|uniref:ABC transporter ATP-binding protein n=1 Tax=Spiroplasma monobiae MQ-1 TaxID=1336748 RepID=A0A2K9LUK9_SPISQ|nr:ABC transporter ATP-binding protein [Spiroplasma monobiae]AUM62601.1 ABC transporter ATP-binding protein [Spiroplasma monobiae MQ-1]